MRLEELITFFEECDQELSVYFDFGFMVPTKLDSWRGIYAELALGYTTEYNSLTVSDLLEDLKSAVGKTYSGYKGGEFRMHKNTNVHVDNYGMPSRTEIVELVETSSYIVIKTKSDHEL